MPKPLEIGTIRQLFIDDGIIDESRGVLKTLNQPVKYAGNPVMIPLYPWEGKVSLYGTVWRDPAGGFRMWYQGYGGNAVPPMAKDISDSPWKGFDASTLLYIIGYATSYNGGRRCRFRRSKGADATTGPSGSSLSPLHNNNSSRLPNCPTFAD